MLAVLGVYAGVSMSRSRRSSDPPRRRLRAELKRRSARLCDSGWEDSSQAVQCSARSRTRHSRTVIEARQYSWACFAATILFIATNAGMMRSRGCNRRSAAHRRCRAFSGFTRRYRTPSFTLVFFSALAGVLILYRRHRACSAASTRRGDAVIHSRAASVIAPERSRSRSQAPLPGALGRAFRGVEVPMTADDRRHRNRRRCGSR